MARPIQYPQRQTTGGVCNGCLAAHDLSIALLENRNVAPEEVRHQRCNPADRSKRERAWALRLPRGGGKLYRFELRLGYGEPRCRGQTDGLALWPLMCFDGVSQRIALEER
eukprot:5153861-Pyramimonas_sp.AAC.1